MMNRLGAVPIQTAGAGMMLGKVWSAVTVMAVAGLLAVPASAATKTPAAATQPADSGTTAKHHRMGCYDYAWESQEMKDCLAKHPAAAKPASHKHSSKKPAA
jgi:hypothetical protein